MNTYIKFIILVLITIVTITNGSAQSRNLKTTEVKVYGNCGMCKKTIEKAGNIKGTSKTVWNPETAMASITFDSVKTSVDAILKKIAAVGYDSDDFRAPDDVYNNLHGCCQYERPAKSNR